MIEFRCEKDNKLLAKISDCNINAEIEIKCPRCGYINRHKPKQNMNRVPMSTAK